LSTFILILPFFHYEVKGLVNLANRAVILCLSEVLQGINDLVI